jgi:hypothetical protein
VLRAACCMSSLTVTPAQRQTRAVILTHTRVAHLLPAPPNNPALQSRRRTLLTPHVVLSIKADFQGDVSVGNTAASDAAECCPFKPGCKVPGPCSSAEMQKLPITGGEGTQSLTGACVSERGEGG